MSWLARMLEEHARLRPRATALVAGDGVLTYDALVRRVATTAGELRRRGVLDGDVLAIALPRGTSQVVAALAAMWVGAPFAIIDVDEPPDRRRGQIRACLATWLVDGSEADTVDGVPTVRLRGVEAPAPAMASPDRDDAAYVVFTSGSTGTPKAVAVPHRALDNYAARVAESLEHFRSTGEQLSFASVTSFATDLGHTAVFPALVSGDAVHLVDKPTMMDPLALGRYMRSHAVDVLKSTPSHISVHLGAGARDVLPRKLMIFGGEALTWDLVDQVLANGTCEVLNHYGPSETTIGVLTYPVDPDRAEHRSSATVPLGTPIGGVSVEVVDEDLGAVPEGEPGELLVWGQCVALGYIGAPDSTRSRFVPLPAHCRPAGDSAVAYRTGDRVRRLPSGDIEFLGREDRQLKLHGQRIELGEVEAALRRHPQVRTAVVSYDASEGLHAHVVPTDPTEPPDTKSLRRFLRAALPVAAIPRSFTVLESVPLTLSGKVDIGRLARSDRADPTTPVTRGDS
ncbi:amino acid adenylation domain-containing protein [Saccharothrix sp. NRRL B-16348]|uniref:amino acid adenylation domain-containing protein n=1 Tax=Saccharothrix sp. NRRL B-16348 TaxID=1415542 RepID=UPI0009EC5634|nr:amino acid adenylation domain-containing protein [Saccharothrix sp. NRRL B-16348]